MHHTHMHNLPSMRSQWPVSTHTQTIRNDRQKERISAGVNLPQQPNEILKTKQNSTHQMQYSIKTATVVGWGGDAVAAAGRLCAFPVVWMSSSMVFHGSSSPTGRGHPLPLYCCCCCCCCCYFFVCV